MADRDTADVFETLDLVPPVAIEEPAPEVEVDVTEPAWSDGWERNLANLGRQDDWETQLSGLAQLMEWRP
jgi:hypothetical protein